MIRIHQPHRARDDAVAVGIGIVAERDVELILELHEPGHCERTGAVHAYLPVVIHRHERERRVHVRIHDGQVQTVFALHGLPIMHRRAAERIDTDLQSCRTNRRHVDHRRQILHVVRDVILLMRGARLQRGFKGHSLHVLVTGAEQDVRTILNPRGRVALSRATVGRIIFHPAIGRRIVRRRDDESVREAILPSAIVNENRARDDGRWREAVVRLNDRLDAIRGEHFE